MRRIRKKLICKETINDKVRNVKSYANKSFKMGGRLYTICGVCPTLMIKGNEHSTVGVIVYGDVQNPNKKLIKFKDVIKFSTDKKKRYSCFEYYNLFNKNGKPIFKLFS